MITLGFQFGVGIAMSAPLIVAALYAVDELYELLKRHANRKPSRK